VKAKPMAMRPYKMSQVTGDHKNACVVAALLFETAQRHGRVADVWADVLHCGIPMRVPRYENRRMTRSALAVCDRSKAANI
jgi:hypothetical protein